MQVEVGVPDVQSHRLEALQKMRKIGCLQHVHSHTTLMQQLRSPVKHFREGIPYRCVVENIKNGIYTKERKILLMGLIC